MLHWSAKLIYIYIYVCIYYMTRDSIQQEINSIWYIGILRSWVIKVTIILTVEKR